MWCFRKEKAKQEVSAQGLLDTLILDKETIDKIKAIIAAVDISKIEAVMDMIEPGEDGWLNLKIDLRIKK